MVHSGNKAFLTNRGQSLTSQIRRSLHKLEKGIYHKNRKKSFGTYIIPQLCSSLKLYLDVYGKNKTTDYAYNVLTKYAAVSEANPSITKEINEIIDLLIPPITIQPHIRKFRKSGRVGLDEAMQQRVSCRSFKKDLVTDEILDRIINIALTAPSACNRQPFQVYISRFGENGHEALCKLPLGTGGWAHSIPCLLFIVGDWSNLGNPRDWLVPVTDSSLFIMQLILAAGQHDLGCCPINWSDIPSKHKELQKHLNLSPYQKCIMALAIGIPDDSPTPLSIKKDAENIQIKPHLHR